MNHHSVQFYKVSLNDVHNIVGEIMGPDGTDIGMQYLQYDYSLDIDLGQKSMYVYDTVSNIDAKYVYVGEKRKFTQTE